MGGKTQQRVAGNVKPSNSGRIRELLINKHGVGNVITFSALSSCEEQESSSQHDDPANNETISKTDQAPQAISNSPLQDKPKLMVRKVGNRDCFTRVRIVKVPDECKNQRVDELSADCSSGTHFGISGSSNFSNTNEESTNSETTTNEINPNDSQTLSVDNALQIQELSEISEPLYNFESLLDRLSEIQDPKRSQLLAVSLNELDDEKISQEMEIVGLLKILVDDYKEELSIEDWDLINRSLHKWVKSISRSIHIYNNRAKVDFCVKVLEFINQLNLLAKKLEVAEESEERFPMMQLLLADWQNFHSSDVYQDLVILFFRMISLISNQHEDDMRIIHSLANILINVNSEALITNSNLLQHLDAKIEFDHDFELPENTRFCGGEQHSGFAPLCNLLKSNCRVITVTAHVLLSRMMSSICESIQISSIMTDGENIEKMLFMPPAALMSILTSRNLMISALLSDFKVGDISVTIDPNTDSYTCVLSYLFAWDLVIQFIVGVDKELGHCIIHGLKKLNLIQSLLDNVFMLVPPLGERDSLNLRAEPSDGEFHNFIIGQPWSLSSFLKYPLKTTVKRPINEIELLALHIYFSIALHMPVTVRKWYNNNSNKKLCNLVNEYTVKHVSSVICSLEMESVQEKCQERANNDKMNNLTIKARPNAREVYAIYNRDEFRMELTIKLPINYPLGSVLIDGGKRVGVTDLKWRSWLLQLTTFLAHQNGPILDGIDLWRRNIDKRFEGIEKCMICFSILHSNYQLPKKKCLTCAKMFHNLCLYKWFETSGNSTCPLCRNTW